MEGVPVEPVEAAKLVVELDHAVEERLRLRRIRKAHAGAGATHGQDDFAALHGPGMLDIGFEVGRRALAVARRCPGDRAGGAGLPPTGFAAKR